MSVIDIILFSKISYDGNKTYTSKSAFLNFGSYTVENRDRVKVIDGTHGVPISTQVSVVRLTNIEGQPNGVKMNDYPSPRITDYFAIIHSDFCLQIDLNPGIILQ